MSAVRRGPLLVAVSSGVLLNPLNSSMIAVALVSLRQDFHASFAAASWLISSYYLASAVGQPVLGRLSDRLGRRRVFLGGLGVVALASLAAPFSPSLGVLLAWRCVQALGTSALFPAGMGMLRDTITERQAQALAVVNVFASVSAGIGPTVAGLFVGPFGWPAIFGINLPVVAFALAFGVRALPRDPVRDRRGARGRALLAEIDVPGIALFSVAIVALLWLLLSLPGGGDWWALPVALAAAAGFVVRERATAEPFVDVRALAADRRLPAVYGRFIAVNVFFYSVFFGIPSYLQEARHLSVEATGLVMLPIAGLGVLTTPAAARLIDRRGSRPALIVGGASMLAGALLLQTIGLGTALAWLVAVLCVLGLANGFNNLGLQAALYATARQEDMGAASGLFMTSRYLGTILSSSLLGIAFGHAIGTPELHAVARVLALLAALVLLSAWRLPRRPAERDGSAFSPAASRGHGQAS